MVPTRPFYYRWISLDRLYHLLYQLNLDPEDNNELLQSILETLHFELLDATLSLVPEEEHEALLDRMNMTDDLRVLFGVFDFPDEVVETVIRKRAEVVLARIYTLLQQTKS
jgi:hypothetical protein